MAEAIGRDDLLKRIDDGSIQVVDVLPEGEFLGSHIPGAVNIPLKALDATTTRSLIKDKPVAVYCHDGL